MELKERTRPGCCRWRPDHGIGQHQSPVRGGISVVTAANNCPAPSGAASSRGTIQSPLSPGRGRSPIPLDAATESARGQAHSKSWRMNPARQRTRSVVECGRPLPLSATVAALRYPGRRSAPWGTTWETVSGEPDSFIPLGRNIMLCANLRQLRSQKRPNFSGKVFTLQIRFFNHDLCDFHLEQKSGSVLLESC